MSTESSPRRSFLVLGLALVLLTATASLAGALPADPWPGLGPGPTAGPAGRAVPVPQVEGPVTGGLRTGGPYWATPFDLRPSGYVEEEYFLSGTASDRGAARSRRLTAC